MSDTQILAEVVARLTGRFATRRILLFGSRASGGATPDSDFDLAVIVDEAPDVYRLTGEMRGALRGLPASFDLLVREAGPWERWAAAPLTLEHHIEREGKVLYDAAA
jgi:predicted nucleotidyltransferase